MDKMKMESMSLNKLNIEKLEELFPSCITEGRDSEGNITKKINFDFFRQMFSDEIIEGEECFEFTWVGKRNSTIEAHKPIRKALRPQQEKSRNWDSTENVYIEGDNLEALKLLQESYLEKVKFIYIDPPYNTGNDFIYQDDYRQSLEEYEDEMGLLDENDNRLFKNTDSNGRFHSDWCSMIYARLLLARNLLSEDGLIIISIDDNELSDLLQICDEVFGGVNHQGTFVINASPSAIDYGCMAKMHEYAVMYSKNHMKVKTNQLVDNTKEFDFEDEQGPFIIYPLYNGNVAFNPTTRPNLYYPFYLNPNHKLDNDFYEIGLEPQEGWVEVWPVVSKKDGIPRVWRWGKEEKARKNLNKEIVGYKNREGDYRIVQKYRSDKKTIRSLLLDQSNSSRRGTAEVQELFGKKVFSFPKPTELIKNFILTCTDEDSIIMDFFSGSATTAHATFLANSISGKRKFILVQYPEIVDKQSEAAKLHYSTLCDIGEDRIVKAGEVITKEIKRNIDTGFRVFRIDESNMNDIYYSADRYSQGMIAAMESNIKPDRTDLDLLFGCVLDWGLPLSLPYTSEEISGVKVHTYNDGDLIACFDENVSEDVVREIAKRQPLRAVFRDSSFSNSPAKINVGEIFKAIAPDTSVKVI